MSDITVYRFGEESNEDAKVPAHIVSPVLNVPSYTPVLNTEQPSVMSTVDVPSSVIQNQDQSRPVEVTNESGDKITVQHYLLTSITTNSPSGRQTSQFFTQPLVIPEVDDSSDSSIPAASSALPENGMTVPLVPADRNGSSFPCNVISEQKPLITSASQNSNVSSNTVIQPNSQINLNASTFCMSSPIVTNVTDNAEAFLDDTSNKATISTNNINSLQVSSNKATTSGNNINLLQSIVENMPGSSSNIGLVTDCNDGCEDFRVIGDANKDYVLANPVTEGIAFQDVFDHVFDA